MITGSDNQLIFASGRVYFGFTSQFNIFPLFLSLELLILSVSMHLFFQISLHRCSLPLPQTHLQFLSPFFSQTQIPRCLSLCVTLVGFLFLCNYTACFLRAVLHPTAAGFLHVSSSPSWCQRLFFCEAVKPNTVFCGHGWMRQVNFLV